MTLPIFAAYERFAASLERSQWLPRPALEAYQRKLLERLAAFAYTNSQFYADRLRPLFRHGNEPDLDAWRDVPILTRRDVAAEIDRINPSTVPDDVGPVTLQRSSGTTDDQITFRTCYLSQMAAACMMQRLYRWRGLDLSAPMASIRYYGPGQREYPEGLTESQWAYPGPQAQHHTLNLGPPIAQLVEWLTRKRPTYLITLPSIAQEIALHADASILERINIKAMIGVSEPTTQLTRTSVREGLHCEIFEVYAAGEVGCIAVQSPVDNSYLVCDETTLVEIVDEAGGPVGPGETGRVIVTGLYNYATPFIRYEVGDFATRVATPCPSGRTLSRLQRIEGRRRNALMTADGRRIWMHDVLDAECVRRLPAVRLQILQSAISKIEICYIPRDRAVPIDRDGLVAYLSAFIGQPIELQLSAVDTLPRTIGGKHESLVSKLAPNA